MGAAPSKPRVLLLGAPQAGRTTLKEALGDEEFALVDEAAAAADVILYVVDATRPAQWTAAEHLLKRLHGVNQRLGRLVPLVVAVNKRDVEGSAPARQVVEELAATGDVCAAVGGRVWRVVDCSAKRRDVAELTRVLRHLAALPLDPVRILAPRCQGRGSGPATGASASLP